MIQITYYLNSFTRIIIFYFRLLDITHGQRRDREMSLHLIFEHIHQDLATYLEKCPPPGLGLDRIKVGLLLMEVLLLLV